MLGTPCCMWLLLLLLLVMCFLWHRCGCSWHCWVPLLGALCCM